MTLYERMMETFVQETNLPVQERDEHFDWLSLMPCGVPLIPDCVLIVLAGAVNVTFTQNGINTRSFCRDEEGYSH